MSEEVINRHSVGPRQAPKAGIKRFKTQTREENLLPHPEPKTCSKGEDAGDTSSFGEDFS